MFSSATPIEFCVDKSMLLYFRFHIQDFFITNVAKEQKKCHQNAVNIQIGKIGKKLVNWKENNQWWP